MLARPRAARDDISSCPSQILPADSFLPIKEGDKVVHQRVGEVSEKGDMGRATT
jgi:hypothetical protein